MPLNRSLFIPGTFERKGRIRRSKPDVFRRRSPRVYCGRACWVRQVGQFVLSLIQGMRHDLRKFLFYYFLSYQRNSPSGTNLSTTALQTKSNCSNVYWTPMERVRTCERFGLSLGPVERLGRGKFHRK